MLCDSCSCASSFYRIAIAVWKEINLKFEELLHNLRSPIWYRQNGLHKTRLMASLTCGGCILKYQKRYQWKRCATHCSLSDILYRSNRLYFETKLEQIPYTPQSPIITTTITTIRVILKLIQQSW